MHSEVNLAIEKVLSENQEIVEKYLSGKTQVLGFLIGQTQKILQGKGNSKLLPDLIASKIQKV